MSIGNDIILGSVAGVIISSILQETKQLEYDRSSEKNWQKRKDRQINEDNYDDIETFDPGA